MRRYHYSNVTNTVYKSRIVCIRVRWRGWSSENATDLKLKSKPAFHLKEKESEKRLATQGHLSNDDIRLQKYRKHLTFPRDRIYDVPRIRATIIPYRPST
ncbi:hypothetical protein Y032_0206g1986 [Ancylostoma ceylanicum]|uniref:Uncharacterized protein n=1 Tax=Ancylostoma ceylanicum TaxID=53326 RepID=A0A016SLA9_9BILA|nr:hypothetical protein Y032_0206g1986 [Ancylostoma ceylanicum]